ncbi:MAG: prolipoprotein diacylglyceryl transferase [Phycisphaeraceae bacterium]|nr:prolipoprotein diacylglyceryl transferase [Phycisphaeraceae bacterium]
MPTLASWLHDLSPFAIKVSDGFGLRWYGLSYAAGFLVAYLFMRTLAARNLILIPKDRVADAMTWLILGVVVGGRLGYALFYDPQLFTNFSSSFPWWGLFALNKGGMASHGGIAGVIIASWWISRGFRGQSGNIVGKCSMLHVLDVMSVAAPPGLFFGRIANFINGELLGKVVAMPSEKGPWWTVQFPQEVLSTPMSQGGHRPPLTIEQQHALDTLILKHALPTDGFEQAYQRVLDQLQRGGEAGRRVAAELAPVISSRHPSQLYQAFAEGIVLWVTLMLIWRKPRVSGVVASWFLIIYGVLRVATEFWRLPDAQLTVQRVLGLSRGQWLSVLMIVAGLLLLAGSLAVARRSSPTRYVGGWGKRASTV